MLVVWWYRFIVSVSSVRIITIYAFDLQVGDTCTLISGQKGICTDIIKCSHTVNGLIQGKDPKICDFDALTPIVCCPISESLPQELTRKGPRISESECYNFYPYPVYQLLGFGNRNYVSDFKHMALVGFVEKNDIQWLCGGSLVSLKFVMTAAHCLNSRDYGPPEWVRLGSSKRSSDNDGGESQQIRIQKRVPHPEYKPPAVYHDIALLELETPARRTTTVAPACLDTNRTHTEKQMIATGWGRTSAFGELSNNLHKANLDVVPVDRCREFYKTTHPRRLPNGIDDDSMICAGEGPLQDTCQGDSGGPLQIISPHQSLEKPYIIVGITSFGKSCGLPNTTGIYTRVYSHLEWLERTIWPSG